MSTVLADPIRFPIGPFQAVETLDTERRHELIDSLARFPARLRDAAGDLADAHLDTRYRDGGWTVRQVVHHVPDSHMNALIRFKLALTEDSPTIKTYDEKAWANLADAATTPIDVSLALLDALHDRWVRVLRAMTADDFRRPLRHPEWGDVDLRMMLRLYAWHGRHHIAHIVRLRERAGW